MAPKTSVSLLFLGVASLVEGGLYPLTSPDNKIHSGSPAEISRFPWTVAILANDGLRCGGGIISEYWVLTAAHCTHKIPESVFKVRAGSSRYDSGGQVYLVDKITNHPNYREKNHHYDISLMKTKTPIRLGGSVSTVKLPYTSPSPSTQLTIVGWGRTEKGNESLTLKTADVVVLGFQTCQRTFPDMEPVESFQICVGKVTGMNCKGDSGSPVVKDGVVYGLVSLAVKDCPGHGPTVFTKVAFFRDWINEVANV